MSAKKFVKSWTMDGFREVHRSTGTIPGYSEALVPILFSWMRLFSYSGKKLPLLKL
jgi:hypothetical protein